MDAPTADDKDRYEQRAYRLKPEQVVRRAAIDPDQNGQDHAADQNPDAVELHRNPQPSPLIAYLHRARAEPDRQAARETQKIENYSASGRDRPVPWPRLCRARATT